MLIKEFRVTMPLTVEEYQIAQLYSVAQASKNETGGGEGIEVLKNEPCDHEEFGKGQYTHKIYHLSSKVPRFVRLLAPKGSLEIHEEAWNCYPYCKTVITNPGYMKDGFFICIETWHKPDRGQEPNRAHVEVLFEEIIKVHNLPPEKLKARDLVKIDIANDPPEKDYKEEEDPTKFHSEKTGRGPLGGNWQEHVDPVMTCYKLVTCEFKWWGLQGRVENLIQKVERQIFLKFHRQLFCWLDKWHGLTMEDIRHLEEETKHELDKQRVHGEARGTTVVE